MEPQDTYDTRQAKQKASVKWLLSKAFNNKVPENLREPFYRDHENQEFLKPQILGSLANAELYCLALGNIYSDPNYHNLNHGSILQTLARKGVLNEPSEVQLTETVLIQTNPLRMSAHMTVIESMMVLYAKEVVTGDRVLAAIQRFNHLASIADIPMPQEHEQGLILWVNHACVALKQRIEQETESGSGEVNKHRPPEFEPLKHMSDLCDGVRLASLISFYCPDELPWNQLIITKLPTVSDSVHNLMLVYDFCRHCLPYSVFHMMPEDVTYLKRAMKQNLVVFLADMFNVLEIHPVKCVRYPGIDKANRDAYPARNNQGVVHKRNLLQAVVTPIPDLRSGLDESPQAGAFQVSRPQSAHLTVRKTQSLQSSPSEFSTENNNSQREEEFVVHKGRVVPTLSSVLMVEEPLVPARLRPAKEKQNNDTKADERGDSRQTAAGKPSNWDDKKTSYAGRRSRKNSISDDSQLTIENFGGSQDNLNLIGRNPDKDFAVHVGRKISQQVFEPIERDIPIRSSYNDNRSTLHIGYDSDSEKQDREKESLKLTRQLSSDAISLKNILHSKQTNNIINDNVDGEVVNKLLSFADISKENLISDQHRIQNVYMHEQDENIKPSTSNILNKLSSKPNNTEKKTTFATLPNTTTWQQQSSNLHQQQQIDNNHTDDNNVGHNLMASQLNDIRMKLEEKRKHIENEKKKIELVVSKQRQKVGKAAFLQAINKGKGNIAKSPSGSSESSSAPSSEPRSPGSDSYGNKPLRTLQDISEDAMSMELKWLMHQDNVGGYTDSRKTPDVEMDLEHYHHSIEKMNSSLHDIQADIQRLAKQQNQIQATEVSLLNEQQKQHALQNRQQQLQQIHPQPYPVQQPYYNNMQAYMSVGHVPQGMQFSHVPPGMKSQSIDQNQFYLHEQPQTQRRTWDLPTDVGGPAYQHSDMRTNKSKSQGFMLHDPTETKQEMRFQNGEHHSYNAHHPTPVRSLSQQHAEHLQNQSMMYSSEPSTPQRASPQHRNMSVHRQISQLMSDNENKTTSFVNISQLNDGFEKRNSSVIHAPIPTPPVDDMEPQNISFIGNSDDNYVQGISKLNISSGTRTYRIPSPTRPHISRNSFQQVNSKEDVSLTELSIKADSSDTSNEKGFYISFDNEQPKKPKPPLRVKRGSPKKEKPVSAPAISSNNNEYANDIHTDRPERIARERHKQLIKELEEEKKQMEEAKLERQRAEKLAIEKVRLENAKQDKEAATALVIGVESTHLDPNSVDEMERKKERIMLLSLQRRQQQEEAKEKKEAEAQARREREKQKEEERQRRKEEQAARRIAILEQHKLKKAIEEAEREGKVLDKSELMGTLKSTTKMRSKASTGRPRPKTIHVDSGSVEMAEGMLQPSQGKKGSTSNLSVNSYTPSSTLRRDYYRGSQDSLADRGNNRSYKDIADENRRMSPCRTTNQSIGRRSSYITSREVQDHGQVRDRPKYPTIQTFKGRKSNSLMNLYGSSSDQDSMVYRYGDTDSGLGRATPPRRAPSPGMGPMRHLPSPSGPGSLPPGFMNKRRVFDDGSSDISSTPSSMMDYTGPRLYKQPTTKSNRGIMLNAVEYCVFPGVVNKEAKHRVLEEIARSESKHFLILFRDAGCQFRALYSYCPDREEVLKLYGTGPKQVNDKMFDRFFKYNSGGKCFSQVHTKHLTVTIDAFTIHNSLWQGKKVNLPSKKDMALVI